jgi:phage tail sheath gpL-like
MAISFETIPSNLLVPGVYTETNADRAASSSPTLPRRAMLVGGRLTGGATATNIPFRVFKTSDGDYHAGVGSMLAEMIRVFKAANPYCELWAIGIDDNGSGVPATGTLTYAGTATAAGSLVLYISPYWADGALRGKYTVAIASGTAASAVATAVAAAITADPYRTVSASPAGAVVTLTARQDGTPGNDISLNHNFFDGERFPAGITCTIVAMASGATNPTVSTAIAALGDTHYTHIVNPWNDATSLTAFENEATRRWEGTVQREAYLFGAASGSLGTLTTLGDGRNNQFSSILGAGPSPTPPWIAAADFAAVDANEFHPGRPLRGLHMRSMVAPRTGSEHTGTDRQALLADGITTFTVDAGGACRIDRIVSTHQEDINGNPSSVWRDRQVAGTLFAIRWDWRVFIGQKYPRHMHAANGSIYSPGLPIITPDTIKAEAIGRAKNVWGYGQGWIETASIEQFTNDLVVERTEDGMDMILVPDLINRLHIVKTRIDFLR